MQSGASDCGLFFALAFAEALCTGLVNRCFKMISDFKGAAN